MILFQYQTLYLNAGKKENVHENSVEGNERNKYYMGRFYLQSDHLWFTHAVGENIKHQNSTTKAQKLCHAE